MLDSAFVTGTTVVYPGLEYERSGYHNLWWGKHYRKEWSTAVRVRNFYIDTAKGGLKVTKEGGSRDTRGSAMYKATDAGYATGYYGGYGTYGVPVIYGEFATAPPLTTVQDEVRVSSRFYETRDKTLIYTLDTHARNLESTDVALSDIATAIANQLRREGLTH